MTDNVRLLAEPGQPLRQGVDMVEAALEQNTLKRRGLGLRGVDTSKTAGGLTLFCPIAGPGDIYLVDMSGNVVHEWRAPVPPGRHAKLLPDGNLFYQGKNVGGDPLFPLWEVYHGGILMELDPGGRVVKEVEHPFHHHDASVMANGNLLVGAVERLPNDLAGQVVGGIPGSEAPDGSIWSDVVYEMTWRGEILWRWSAAEELGPAELPLDLHFEREHWPMCNSVEETAGGDILLGYRSASTCLLVDRHTRKIKWRLGPEELAQQHHPHMLDNGNILVFDNGSFRSDSSVPYSRVIEVDPTNNNHLVWEYKDSPVQNFYSPYMSNAQRLWNGNTLISEGTFGRIFEVTRGGETVWDYVVPFFYSFPDGTGPESSSGPQNAIFRAYRYPQERFPWLGNPPTPSGA